MLVSNVRIIPLYRKTQYTMTPNEGWLETAQLLLGGLWESNRRPRTLKG